MWWHGGTRLKERSERGSLSAVATHDVFGFLSYSSLVLLDSRECLALRMILMPETKANTETIGTAIAINTGEPLSLGDEKPLIIAINSRIGVRKIVPSPPTIIKMVPIANLIGCYVFLPNVESSHTCPGARLRLWVEG
jgi:hypothetical protein